LKVSQARPLFGCGQCFQLVAIITVPVTLAVMGVHANLIT